MARKWGTEMEAPQISPLALGILLGITGLTSLLPVFVFCVELLDVVIILTNILLLARGIVFVIKPVVKIMANDHPSLLNQMRIIFFLILSNESLFFDGLVIALMLTGIFILVQKSDVKAIDVGLNSLAVTPVLAVLRIITASIS
uniref:Uncharacterized protein n=1 Tax=Sphaerodactylus townsendi TaxID=933632 RepID=A0ACB8EF29_9SAUR